MPVTLKAFSEAKDTAELQRKMKEAINKAVDGGDVRYVAAKNYKIGTKFTSLFLVVDKPAEFLAIIKKQGSTVPFAEGNAKITKTPDNKTKILVTAARGSGLSTLGVSTLIKSAAGNDADYVGTTPEREQADAEALESENAKRPKPAAVDVAKASHAQAREEGLIDYEVEFTKEVVTAIAKASLESAEFGKFNQNFTAFLKHQGLDKLGEDAGKLPVKIWGKLMQGLIKSGYVKEIIPKAKDGTSFILATKGPQGQPIREKLLAQAMEGLQPFVEHAGRYMDKVVDKAKSGATWAFWSGAGALDSAKATPGISLEGSVGSFFEQFYGEYINFPKLTGVADLALWAAMSELYAKKAAENISKFKFIGFVGPGATREQSVFNQIEQPTFIEVAGAKAQSVPSITWYVVDCEKNSEGRWVWTKKAPEQFKSRESALSRIVERYGS